MIIKDEKKMRKKWNQLVITDLSKMCKWSFALYSTVLVVVLVLVVRLRQTQLDSCLKEKDEFEHCQLKNEHLKALTWDVALKITRKANINLSRTILHKMTDFFTIVAGNLILLSVAISAFVADVIAAVASLVLFLTVSCQMTDTIAFVAFLTWSRRRKMTRWIITPNHRIALTLLILAYLQSRALRRSCYGILLQNVQFYYLKYCVYLIIFTLHSDAKNAFLFSSPMTKSTGIQRLIFI